MKAISSLASSVFIGRVTSVTSDAQKRTIHIDVTIAWKGITVGKRHTMVSETNRSLLVPGPEVVGKRFLLMASGDPLVWSSCTFAMDISDLKGRELAAKIRAWSKAVGIKAKFK